MIWLLVVLASLLIFLGWLLVSPVELEIDSRIPNAKLRWASAGKAVIWYDDEWWLSMRILFYKKTVRFSEIKRKPKKIKEAAAKKKPEKRVKRNRPLKKIVRMIKTFQVTDWKLALDTGDYTLNAQIFPLNFFPYTFKHLLINNSDENYLVLKIRSRPWKMLYAFLR